MSLSRTISRASVLSTDSSTGNNIKVIARFRPENETELQQQDHSNIVEFLSEDTVRVDVKDSSSTFTFDRVFDCQSKQADVFEYSLRQTVDDLLKGYNGTVLAYGQTGSGKSHTMMGPNMDDEQLRGAIPRIVDLIFDMILQSPTDIEYTVRVSYMEIYMEKIKDLLNPVNDNLPIHEDKTRGVYVKGLTEEYASSAQEVFDVMRQGAASRSVASTNMNSESSRSHSIFAVVVSQKNVTTGSQKTGQLFLVDLAGSEKVGKTGASGQTLEEAKKINKSLSALGNVINSLTDGKSSHVPYRDSKLTRILQESLGGNSRTSLIVNCSPASYNDQETISTLRFGVRAKTIRNKAKINAELSPSELRAILRKVQGQLDSRASYEQKLESELLLWRNGVGPAKTDWVEFLPSIASNLNRPSSPTIVLLNSPARGTAIASSPIQTPLRRLRNIDTSMASPSIVQSPGTEIDPIEEYLKRENDLQDSITAKDSVIDSLERELELKAASNNVELDRLSYEKKELSIKVTTLEQEIQHLMQKIDDTKEEVLQAKLEREEALKKSEGLSKQATTIASTVSTDARISSKRNQLDEAIVFSPSSSRPDSPKSPKSKTILRDAENKFSALVRRIDNGEDTEARELYEERAKINNDTIAQLMTEIDRLTKQRQNLKSGSLTTSPIIGGSQGSNSRRSSSSTGISSNEQVQAMQSHISQFEAMKQNLMRDLQDRCERIVELEISLDQAREQYNIAFENNNNKQQQRKIAILQRNLEQLTTIQRQVIEQNASLKKEVVMSQKLLESRNQRIKTLEKSLSQSHATLAREQDSYETKLGFLKDRVLEIRNSKGVPTGNMGLKIIKPLRGGGGGAGGAGREA